MTASSPAVRSARQRYFALLGLRWVPTGLYITVFVLLMRDRGLSLAQIGLGWFAVQLSWLGWKTGTLPRSFVLFGFLSGAAGLLMAVAYIPVYLFTVLVWSLWLAVVWRRP